jgi:short subunit dehydrogenase-like uncharacterized protein
MGRIVLYGATGYMGELTARAMVASGARPVLAGRNRDRLNAVAGALALQAAGSGAVQVQVGYFVRGNVRKGTSAGTRASVAGVLLEAGYTFRRGRIVNERTAAHVRSFDIDGKRRPGFSIGSSEQFALPRLRAVAAESRGTPAPASLTDVGVYLGSYGDATRLVHYLSALAAPLNRLPGARRALDRHASRIQRSRAGPRSGQVIRSDVVAVASDASGKPLAAVRLAGGDPYSFTAPMLAWAANQAAAHGVRPAGALGPAEAFGLTALETACAKAGFGREPHPPSAPSTAKPSEKRQERKTL